MATLVMVLCHQPIPYMAQMARLNPDFIFVIHADAKVAMDPIANDFAGLSNVVFVNDRVSCRWGGYSLVEATLRLMNEAARFEEVNAIHFVSGNCVFLQDVRLLEKDFFPAHDPVFYMEYRQSDAHAYRLAYDLPHADTSWQRSLLGKLITLSAKWLYKVSPTKGAHPSKVFGSQWFSMNRSALLLVLSLINEEFKDFFRKKLCPDEHFFQYLIQKFQLSAFIVGDSRRFVFFESGANNPNILNEADISAARKQGFWLARKVEQDLAIKLLGE